MIAFILSYILGSVLSITVLTVMQMGGVAFFLTCVSLVGLILSVALHRLLPKGFNQAVFGFSVSVLFNVLGMGFLHLL